MLQHGREVPLRELLMCVHTSMRTALRAHARTYACTRTHVRMRACTNENLLPNVQRRMYRYHLPSVVMLSRRPPVGWEEERERCRIGFFSVMIMMSVMPAQQSDTHVEYCTLHTSIHLGERADITAYIYMSIMIFPRRVRVFGLDVDRTRKPSQV